MGRPNILYTAFVAQDYFSTPVKKMGSSLKGLTTITSLASAKMVASLSKVSAAATEVGMAGIGLAAGIILPFGLATKAAIGFQAQMANVSTLVDTSIENMDAMGDAVLRLSRKIPKPISDLTEGLYYIRSAGIGAADAMGVLEASGKLAVAGLSTTTEAAKAITSAMVSFKAEGLSATQVANSFFLTVREGKTKMENINESFGATALVVASAGVKLEEFNGAVAALTNTGMEASLAQIGVKNTIIGLVKPTNEMRTVLDALNVSTGEQLIAMLGYGGAIDAVAEKSKSLNIEQAKLFNRTAFTTFLGLSGQAKDQRIRDTKEQMGAQDALTEATAKQMATAAAQMAIFQNTVRTLGISLGHILIPPLTKMVSVISPIIDAITSFSKHHKILSGIIVTSVAGIGLFAGAVGVAGIVVGTLSKALKGLIVINSLFGASEVTTAAETSVMTAALTAEKAAASRGAVAMEALGVATKTAMLGAARLTAIVGALYIAYKQVAFWRDRSDKKKDENPLGYDYSKSAEDPHNAAKLQKYHQTKEDFDKQKMFYDYQEHGNRKPGQKKKHAHKDLFHGFGWFDGDEPTVPQTSSADDSVLIDQQNKINKQRDSDTLYNKPVSANYTPRNGSQNITITLENNSGMTASVKQNSGGTAETVPIKLVSTTSKRPKQPIA